MNIQFRFSIAGLMSAAIVVAGLALGAVTAGAQPIIWNPPCTTVKVINTTNCPAVLTLATIPPGAVAPITIPPCFSVLAPGGGPPMRITGVFTQAGTFVPMVSPGPIAPPAPMPPMCLPAPPASPLGPADGWVKGVTVGTAGAVCCVDVYFYSTSDPLYPCTVWLFPGTPPCTP